MDSRHYINEKTHHIDELSMRPSEMDLVAILHNSDILVPILVTFTILVIFATLPIFAILVYQAEKHQVKDALVLHTIFDFKSRGF